MEEGEGGRKKREREGEGKERKKMRKGRKREGRVNGETEKSGCLITLCE